MSKRVVDYIGDFRSIGFVRERIIVNMKGWFKSINSEIGVKGVCGEIESSENSIKIRFLEHHIFIRIDICASRNGGFIKWFYPKLRPDGKTVTLLIVKDEFIKDIGIKGNDLSKMGYDYTNMTQYCFDALGKYLEKVD